MFAIRERGVAQEIRIARLQALGVHPFEEIQVLKLGAACAEDRVRFAMRERNRCEHQNQRHEPEEAGHRACSLSRLTHHTYFAHSSSPSARSQEACAAWPSGYSD